MAHDQEKKMTPDIPIGRPAHLSSDAAYNEVADAVGEGREIGDACAVTIASWWQSPRNGALTSLSTRGVLQPTLLLEEISLSRSEVQDERDSLALDKLARWAMARHDAAVK